VASGEPETSDDPPPASGGTPPSPEAAHREADHEVLATDFGVLDLVRASLRTYRKYPARVAVPAAVVFGTSAVVDSYGLRTLDTKKSTPLIVLAVVVLGLTSIGETFYAGLLDRLVGTTERGHPPPPVTHVLRTLPYVRLIVADLLLTAITAALSFFFVVPGVVAFTLFALVGPLINLEDHGILAAFGRSFSLVRRRFAMTLGVVTLPILIEHEVLDLVAEATHDSHLVVIFTASALTGAVIGSFVGLLEVFMAERLTTAYPPEGPPRGWRATLRPHRRRVSPPPEASTVR